MLLQYNGSFYFTPRGWEIYDDEHEQPEEDRSASEVCPVSCCTPAVTDSLPTDTVKVSYNRVGTRQGCQKRCQSRR